MIICRISLYIVIIIGFYTYCFTPKVIAQEIEFEQISIESGLSQGSVHSITQDSDDFMWFGTEDGLNKYDGYRFVVFRNNSKNPSSISNNDIKALYVDNNDNLWIGTLGGGFCKFIKETETFECYQHDPSDPNSISGNLIRSITSDSNGYIWISTTGSGINKFDPTTKKFTTFLSDENNPKSIPHNKSRAIYHDSKGRLWVGTEGGLCLFDKEKGECITIYKHNKLDPNSISSNKVRRIFEDKSGNFWLGTKKGLNKFNPKTGTFISYQHDPKNPNSISNNDVRSIYEDKKGTLWVSTDGGGLNLFDRGKKSFKHFRYNSKIENGISHDDVKMVFGDKTGTIWIGTDGGGINKYSSIKSKFKVYRSNAYNDNSLSNNFIRAFCMDRDGMLWIGTDGGGVNLFNQKTNKFRHYIHDASKANTISENFIRAIFEDHLGEIWIGTDVQGLNRYNKKTSRFKYYLNDPNNPHSLPVNDIRSIYEDSEKTLWIATDGKGLCKYNRKTNKFISYLHDPNNQNSISDDEVWVLFEDRNRTLWLGTKGGGLNSYDKKTNNFTRYLNNPNDSLSISSNDIRSIYESENNTIWIGTMNGLNKYNSKNNSFSVYTIDDGLPHNAIYGILEDDHENLWISTINGLSKFTPATETFRNFDTSDGLQSNEFSVGASAKSDDGKMFFGGINGFNAFFPDSVKNNENIPKVMLTELKIFTKPVKVGTKDSILNKHINHVEKLILNHKQSVFSIEYAALDFISSDKNKYAYKLEGFDNEWRYVGNIRSATYTNLDPGKYIFKVKASNNDGIWNETGSSLQIIILPPWWETWWFRGGSILFLISVVIGIYLNRIRVINRQKEVLEKQVAARTFELVEKNEEVESQKESLEKAYDDIQKLTKIGRELSDNLSIEKLTKTLYYHLNTIMDAPGVGIGIYHEQENTIEFKGFVENGILLPVHFHEVDERKEFSAWSLINKKEIVINDYKNEALKYIDKIKESADMGELPESFIYLPLILDEVSIGVMTIQSFQKNSFSDYHLNILNNLAAYLVIALKNAKAYNKIEAQKGDIEKKNKELLISEEEIRQNSEETKIINEKLAKSHKELEESMLQLEHAKKESEQANKAKTQFLANMSHEIRSPLNAIVGFSQIMINMAGKLKLPFNFSDNLNHVVNAGQNLSELINNILDLSKIESGKMEVLIETINFKQLFQGIYHINKGNALKKEINYSYNYSSQLPEFIKCDRTKLNQILMNLVSNAIKFTPVGNSIFIEADLLENQIIIKVKDEGIGIDEERLDKVFESFEQADNTITRSFGGTGLGLAISKEMVEMLDGTIWVESKKGEGSTFFVKLPLIRAEQQDNQQEAITLSSYHFSPENVILGVDDIELNQLMLKSLFNELNLNIHLASSGKEGIDKVKKLKPDLILMDIHMPGMDGIEASKKIREIEEFKNIPIVAVSADAFIEQQNKALEAGLNDYITKPIDIEKLLPVLSKYLKEDTDYVHDSENINGLELTIDDKDQLLSGFKEILNIPSMDFEIIDQKVQNLKNICQGYKSPYMKVLDEIEDVLFSGQTENIKGMVEEAIDSLDEKSN